MANYHTDQSPVPLDYYEIKSSGTEGPRVGLEEKKIIISLGYPFGLQIPFLQGLRESHFVSEEVMNAKEVSKLFQFYHAKFPS